MGKFSTISTPIDGLLIIEPTVFGDSRGFFMETYTKRDFQQIGIESEFVQDNHSCSSKGVLRGLHFQRNNPQGKLIRVVSGSVYDVAVDLRTESKSFGQWFSIILSSENKRQFYIPPRFAHGFLVLEDNTEFVYKCTEYYDPQSDAGLLWNDKDINVDWKLEEFGLSENQILLSDKDIKQPLFKDIKWQETFL
ncbi:MAG: dTDP-4-dehydrorhamnose 3,5-epimerase [Rikenellaceae bacterium]